MVSQGSGREIDAAKEQAMLLSQRLPESHYRSYPFDESLTYPLAHLQEIDRRYLSRYTSLQRFQDHVSPLQAKRKAGGAGMISRWEKRTASGSACQHGKAKIAKAFLRLVRQSLHD